MNIAIERVFESKDVFTILFVILLLLITMMRFLFPKKITAYTSSLISSSFFLNHADELSRTFHWFKTFLFVVQNLILAIFFFTVASFFYRVHFGLTRMFLWISIYLIVKYFLELFLARVFQYVGLFKKIHLLKFTYLKHISLALFPLVLLMIYGTPEYKGFFIKLGLVYFVLALFLRGVLVFVKNNNLVFSRLFYVILYLCTLEIAPVLIMIKLTVK